VNKIEKEMVNLKLAGFTSDEEDDLMHFAMLYACSKCMFDNVELNIKKKTVSFDNYIVAYIGTGSWFDRYKLHDKDNRFLHSTDNIDTVFKYIYCGG